MQQQNNYTVYEIFFEETNQVFYVGVTTSHLMVRLGQHLSIKHRGYETRLKDNLIQFWDNGIKYNIRAVKSNCTKYDALSEERRLIKQYKDNIPFFNINCNPNTIHRKSIPVCKIDRDSLKVIKTYKSLRDTEKDGYAYPNIVKVCEKKVNHAYGFYWSYKKDIENFVPRTKKKSTRPVEVFDEYGKLLHHFNSMTEAAQHFEVSVQTITRYVNERPEWKVYGNSYKKSRKTFKYQQVQIFTVEGDFIEEVDNISEYCRQHNIDISSAYKVLNGRIQFTKGLKFISKQI